ncbi:DUF7548 family protein [Halomicrobium urmianum]|uniref:DUF7548 family protein n=1 Tax=Halomicrobium urmianum TaxID=1586233 RepID=UPI001CD94E73|nr:hypothetical protein [Halomicrobium urmianum]
MDALRLAPTVGIVASLAVLVALLAPFLAVEQGSAVGTYYGAGAVNGLSVGLFAAVALVAFAAGREGRSAPDTIAGVTIVLGLFAAVMGLLWAFTVPQSLVTQLTTATWLNSHRWLVVALTIVIPVAAGWYARAQRLL